MIHHHVRGLTHRFLMASGVFAGAAFTAIVLLEIAALLKYVLS